MPLLNIVVMLILVGVGLYLVNRFIPMASSIKSILNVVVVVCVCIWLLQAVGLWSTVSSVRVPR
ncbi:Thivi_2564 family membrane protein [Paludibaculum fermentans]|uniref:Thivi_2564 family membrane protein n=1 Tax=Paludibaculum fermentans TaxID=1473598 RepID=UPI003EC0EE37